MLILGGIRKQLCSKVRYMWDVSRCIYTSDCDWSHKMKTLTYQQLLLRCNLGSWLENEHFSQCYWMIHLKQLNIFPYWSWKQIKYSIWYIAAGFRAYFFAALTCCQKPSIVLSVTSCQHIKQCPVIITPVKCTMCCNEAERPSSPQCKARVFKGRVNLLSHLHY